MVLQLVLVLTKTNCTATLFQPIQPTTKTIINSQLCSSSPPKPDIRSPTEPPNPSQHPSPKISSQGWRRHVHKKEGALFGWLEGARWAPTGQSAKRRTKTETKRNGKCDHFFLHGTPPLLLVLSRGLGNRRGKEGAGGSPRSLFLSWVSTEPCWWEPTWETDLLCVEKGDGGDGIGCLFGDGIAKDLVFDITWRKNCDCPWWLGRKDNLCLLFIGILPSYEWAS